MCTNIQSQKQYTAKIDTKEGIFVLNEHIFLVNSFLGTVFAFHEIYLFLDCSNKC